MKALFDVWKYQRQEFIKRTIFTSVAWVIIQLVFGVIGYFISRTFTKSDLIIRLLSLLGGIVITTILNAWFMINRQDHDNNEVLK